MAFEWPMVIQGGMGIGVSTWKLAREVSLAGGLGTVSGTAIEVVFARKLQNGDEGGHVRRALAHFPFQEIAQKVLATYFVEGGIPAGAPYRKTPRFGSVPALQDEENPKKVCVASSDDFIELCVCMNFAAIWLAKEGHTHPVSVNYLEKIQIHPIALTGAILAGVDVVTMGAGIPTQIPATMRAIVEGSTAKYRLYVEGDITGPVFMEFNPREFFGDEFLKLALKIPRFLPIVANHTLAERIKKVAGCDGFVIETEIAGGHNVPPRGNKVEFDSQGEPIYGPRDEVDWEKMRSLGLPFWIGGAFASPEGLARARELGAHGIQAGSVFALSSDSGMSEEYRGEIRRKGFRGELQVKTDMLASPTTFPFKVVSLEETLSEEIIYISRKRNCSKGYLIIWYLKPDGKIGSRCPAEPVDAFVLKGGSAEDTVCRKCICNGLFATVGLGDPGEPAIVTLGGNVSFLRHLMKHENDTYTAKDAMQYILGK